MEDTRKQITDELIKIGATDIEFTVFEKEKITAVFNGKEITSFVANIPYWNYSGIHLDSTGKHQYEIDFKKIVKFDPTGQPSN